MESQCLLPYTSPESAEWLVSSWMLTMSLLAYSVILHMIEIMSSVSQAGGSHKTCLVVLSRIKIELDQD